MNIQFMRQSNSNIRSLFQKMDSNITKFKESMSSSPNIYKPNNLKGDTDNQQSCNCIQEYKQRQQERSFYASQLQFIKKALITIDSEQNDIYIKLLSFMEEYLIKIVEQLKKQIICSCKFMKINEYDCLFHKINFLREQNHKFFKLIQEKTQECELLKQKLHTFEFHSKNQSQTIKSSNSQVHLPFLNLLSSEISSRNNSSNSSRISQFKNHWGDLSFPMCEGGHKKYFEIPVYEKVLQNEGYQILQQKQSNIPEANYTRKNNFQSTFRKPKIF